MDAKAYEEHKKNCKKCNRKGLPILLTRYAIAPTDSGAPEVNGPFKVVKDKDENIIKLDSNTVYTQRLPRAGYIYVYDSENLGERNQKAPWKGYVVDKLGYLTPFPVPTPKSYVMPDPNSGEPPCDAWANEMLARCISVVNPEKARTIWIGFSDTRWTDAVLKENSKEETRDRHMRKFNVGQWWSLVTHDHACTVDQCSKHLTVSSKKPGAFEFSPAPLINARPIQDLETLAKLAGVKMTYPPSSLNYGVLMTKLVKEKSTKEFGNILAQTSDASAIGSLSRVAERLLGADNKHKAAIVALDDPAGILMDLASYMDYRLEEHAKKVLPKQFEWELATAASIEGIYNNYVNTAKDWAPEDVVDQEGTNFLYHEDKPQDYYAMMKAAEMKKNPEKAKEYARNKWKRLYDPKYDENARKSVPDKMLEALKKYDKDELAPLANAHTEWFESDAYTNYMELNHDSKNIESGMCYSMVVSLCIGLTQSRGKCVAMQIRQMLHGRVDNKKDIIQRALIFNQEAIADKIVSVSLSSDLSPGVSLDKHFKVWKDFLKWSYRATSAFGETTVKHMDNIFARLARLLSSAIIGASQAVSTVGPMKHWMLSLGMSSASPIGYVTVEDGPNAIQKGLWEDANKYRGKNDPISIERFGSADRIANSPGSGPRGQGMDMHLAYVDDAIRGPHDFDEPRLARKTLVMYNRDVLYSGSKANADAEYVLKKSMSMAEYQKSSLIYSSNPVDRETGWNWRKVEIHENVEKEVRRSLPVGATVVGALLQVGTLMVLHSAVKKDEKYGVGGAWSENNTRFLAAWAGLVDSLGSAIEQIQIRFPSVLKYAPALLNKDHWFLRYGMKGLGPVPWAVGAAWDYEHAEKAWNNGETGLAVLYAVSSLNNLAGFSLSIFMLTRFAALFPAILPGIGVVILVVMVVLTALISIVKDEPFQDWLGRCIFGKKTNKFNSLYEETAELRKLVGA